MMDDHQHILLYIHSIFITSLPLTGCKVVNYISHFSIEVKSINSELI